MGKKNKQKNNTQRMREGMPKPRGRRFNLDDIYCFTVYAENDEPYAMSLVQDDLNPTLYNRVYTCFNMDRSKRFCQNCGRYMSKGDWEDHECGAYITTREQFVDIIKGFLEEKNGLHMSINGSRIK